MLQRRRIPIGVGQLFAIAICLTGRAAPTVAGEIKATPVDYARDIRPILSAHCTGCHGSEKQEAGLRLDHRESAMRGGDSGLAFVPHRSADSELVQRILSEDEDVQMPPVKAGPRLPAHEIALVKRWIDQGADWPVEPADAKVLSQHWAYQPVRRAEPPLAGRARSPVDAFVLARLEQERIAPAREASRETLLRRLYLDLLGLLPTPDERVAFLADESPDAYERLVDRLLASPHFGERWGRHWLDLARYGDSNGYELDIVRPNAWRYRDWVVKAINDDMPYDQFIVDQIAGDCRPNPSVDQQLATGFHRMTIKNTESGINAEDYRNREMVDRVNTTAASVLGVTLGCAQCHSHKYDPFSQQEYYRFYAFFDNLEEVEVDLTATAAEKAAYVEALSAYLDKWLSLQARQRIVDGLEKHGAEKASVAVEAALGAARKQLAAQRNLARFSAERWVKEAKPDEVRDLAPPDGIAGLLRPKGKGYDFQQKSLVRYLDALPALNDKLDKLVQSTATYAALLDEAVELQTALCLSQDQRTPDEQRVVEDYHALLPAKKDEVHTALRMLVTEERYLPTSQVLAVKENTVKPRATFVLLRGDFKQHGAQVEPGTPGVLPALKSRGERADRLDLARWLADPANPLTARVAANHIWAHLFGRGLVATVDDFGVQGDRPSHPQLLDWLASELVRVGWSRKQLIRAIVLSSTYRQSSAVRGELIARDPLNTLVAQQGRFRVEAEIVRDLFLSASGLLNHKLGGPTIYPAIPDSVRDIAYKYQIVWPTSSEPERYRRGMYIHFRRSNPYPSLSMFDAPEGVNCTAQRNRSNTPLQALTTLNDPVFMENAQALGRRVLAEGPADVKGRLQWLFVDCLGRAPQAGEMAILRALFEAELAAYQADSHQAQELTGDTGGREPVDQLAAWTAAARAVMNLDEFITRE